MSDNNVVAYALTIGDIENLVGRPLLPGEASSITKSLEHAIGDVWEDAVYSTTDLIVFEEIRASELEDGDIYRDFGDDNWTEVLKVEQHGDTMLIITKPDADELTLDIDTVIERVEPGSYKSEEDA